MARKPKTRHEREIVTPSSGMHSNVASGHSPTIHQVKLDAQKLTMSSKEVLDPNLVSSLDQPHSNAPMLPLFTPDDASSVASCGCGEDAQGDCRQLAASQVSKRLSRVARTAEGSNSAYLQLDASNLQVEDISVLESYQYLQKVDLSYNRLEDVSALNCVRDLVEIDVSHNRLRKLLDFDPPKVNLRKADYSSNSIKTIGCLNDYICLSELNLSFNGIEQIEGLEGCCSLKRLNLSHNRIDAIDGVEKLKLHELDLSRNGIVAIDKLHKIRRLVKLDLSHNNIESLSGLNDKPVLDTLLLDDNSVMAVDQVDFLVELKNLRTFSLQDNHVQMEENYRKTVVFKLQWLTELDNVPVTCQEKVDALNLFAPPLEVQASHDHMTHLVYGFMQPQLLRESTLPSFDTPYPMMVLCGPQLSGKRELCHLLADNMPDYFAVAVSHTTRPARKGEKDGRDYHFVSNKKFEDLVKQGEFVQTFRKKSHRYGLTMRAIESVAQQGLACVAHMELEGVYSIKATHFEPRYVLVLPTTDEQHLLRFYERGINGKEEIRKVCFDDHQRYVGVNANHPGFFDTVICDDVLSQAHEKLQKLVVGYLGVSEAPKVVQQRIGFNDSTSRRSVKLQGAALQEADKSHCSTVASSSERSSQYQRRQYAAMEAVSPQKSKHVGLPLTAPSLLQGNPLAQARSLYQDPAFGVQMCDDTERTRRETFDLPSPENFYDPPKYSSSSADVLSDSAISEYSSKSSKFDRSARSSLLRLEEARGELVKEPLDLSKLNMVKMTSSLDSSRSSHATARHQESSLHHGLNTRPVLPPIPSRTPVN